MATSIIFIVKIGRKEENSKSGNKFTERRENQLTIATSLFMQIANLNCNMHKQVIASHNEHSTPNSRKLSHAGCRPVSGNNRYRPSPEW